MLKAITITSLMLLLCSCEIFGWDSSGGNNEDAKTEIGDPEGSIDLSDLFYLDVPMGYPNAGSAVANESGGGSQISIPNLEGQPRSIIISEANALTLTKAACDQTAVSILNISLQETETTITWQNDSMSMGSLSLSKEEVSDPPLLLITCIN